ncbi:MAG: hypothetical protein RIC15_10095 [Vicingaceae bacterium]
MRFKDIPNYDEVKNRLIASFTKERVGHSLLFLGDEGSPALSIAISFAQYLSCESKTTNDSCGECRSCVKFLKYAHPDLHFYYPTATSKKVPKKARSQHYASEWRKFLTENKYSSLNDWLTYMDADKKQAIIPTDDSLQVIKDLSLKSFESPYRFAIIWLPEKMNVHSSNRLLKIIEEPPENVFFFLVTENQESILPTILSRTQIVRIGKMENEVMNAWLSNEYNEKNESERAFAMKYAEGNPLKAIESLKKKADHTELSEKFVEWARMCFIMHKKLPELLDWCDQMASETRSSQRDFMLYGLDFFRAGLLNNHQSSDLLHLFPEEEVHVKNFSSLLNLENIPKLVEEFDTALANLNRNANAKILFMQLSGHFGKLINPKNVNL